MGSSADLKTAQENATPSINPQHREEMKRKMKTLMILMLALCSLSAGEKLKLSERVFNVADGGGTSYVETRDVWIGNLVTRRETNWTDGYWQTESGTVSSNTYIVGTYHGKTTTNLIESATITNLTRRYNIKQVRDYTGPFPNLYATNQIITNFVWH
jgi:hypothetical protein